MCCAFQDDLKAEAAAAGAAYLGGSADAATTTSFADLFKKVGLRGTAGCSEEGVIGRCEVVHGHVAWWPLWRLPNPSYNS
jgi:hypothetical protein